MTDARESADRTNSFRKAVRRLSEQIPGTESAVQRRILQYEAELAELRSRVRFLEEEAHQLRRRLESAPREFQYLDSKLRQSNEALAHAHMQNERLVQALNQAREQVQALKEEVEKLTAPPASYAVFSGRNEDGTIDILTAGRKMKVNLHPALKEEELRRGQELVLNDAFNAIEAKGFEGHGEVVQLKSLLEPGRAIVALRGDEERVAELAEPLQREALFPGDRLLYDPKSGYLYEKLPKPDVVDLLLEEVPDLTYDNIGGLQEQIEKIRDAIEVPYLYAEAFKEHRLTAPKGVLLYGPPGCGKTLIAKAVANSLARKIREQTGSSARSYFLNVKGPELLNKYVGETERMIREVFRKAREQAREGMPVIIFFDELDSLFRTRGSGISSDVESTVVPQFLAEIDGVEGLRNVIVIGASNRQDLIDPAVLRPGRLDVKIRVDRPNREAARDIFFKYLTADLPFDAAELAACGGRPEVLQESLIDRAVEEMYSQREENRFLEVTYANGERETLYFKDFTSGAMIENVVRRAKKRAIKRLIATEVRGIRLEDLLHAVKEEFKENEDLPNTTNPDDWVKISGGRNEKIVHVQAISSRVGRKEPKIENIPTGQYL